VFLQCENDALLGRQKKKLEVEELTEDQV